MVSLTIRRPLPVRAQVEAQLNMLPAVLLGVCCGFFLALALVGILIFHAISQIDLFR